tara:strand:+ start:1254 stop:2756 length:1503 start_codon:yes stop_codon:yes gene_type:complete
MSLLLSTAPAYPRVVNSAVARAAIEAARKNNAYTTPPWGPAPTWAALTVYRGGMVTRGLTAGSTTNLYLCAGSTSGEGGNGTSAAATGPTGTGSALITDGTVVWQYIGQTSSTGTVPYYSTVTPTTSSDVMNGYIAVVDQGNYAAMGLTNTNLTSGAPLVRLTNTVLTNAITPQPKNSGTVGSPTRNSSSIKTVARFVTNSKKWIAFTAANSVYQYSNVIRQIKVNGRFLSEQAYLGYTGSTINPGAILLDLSSFPAGNKVIEVLVSDTFAAIFTGIAVGVDEFVYPYGPVNNFKIALEGDSITDMTYLSAYDTTCRFEMMLNEWLGCDNVYNNAIGGTGIISDNSSAATTYAGRLADIVTFAPTLLIINGAHNDVDKSTPGAIRQALYLAYLRAARTALPNCTICLTGNHLLATETVSTQVTSEEDLSAAFTAFADSNSFFVPILTATPRMLNSANGYMFQQGGVPAAYTNSHPVSWYYYHIVRYVADKIYAYYSAQTT